MSSDCSPAGAFPVTQTVSTAPVGSGDAAALVSHFPRVAVIPAAGFGTRLRPLTDSLPKEMLPLGRQTALDHIIGELSAAGVTRIVLVVSPAKEALLRAAFATRPGLQVHFAVQPEMRGLGDAILQAAPYLDGEPSFFVALGDAVYEEDTPGTVTRRLLDACASASDTHSAVGLAVQEVPLERVSRYGVVRPVAQATEPVFRFDAIIEKPAADDAPSRYAAAARYVLPAAILPALSQVPADKKGEVQLTPAMQTLLSKGYMGVAVPLQDGEVRHDIGNFDSYFRAFCTFALSDPDFGNTLGQSLRADFARHAAKDARQNASAENRPAELTLPPTIVPGKQ